MKMSISGWLRQTLLVFGFLIYLQVFQPKDLQAQSKEYNKTIAQTLIYKDTYCSAETAFKTQELDYEQPIGSCYDKEHLYGAWFTFTAQTSSLELTLKTGALYGTLQFPYVYLWDDQWRQIACNKYSETAQTDFLHLVKTDLEVGKNYYIQVSHVNNSEYAGSFTLCLQSKLSYDHWQGALVIPKLKHYCTTQLLSTKMGTPDEHKSSCLEKGPNFNRWFSFTPKSNKLQISVLPIDIEGNFQFPYLALFDASHREVKCVKYLESTQDQGAVLEVENLKPGQSYYLSVDHASKASYTGSFQICFDDLTDSSYYKFYGKLIDENQNPISLSAIRLLSQSKVPVYELMTDRKGVALLAQHQERIFYIKTSQEGQKFQGFILNQDNDIVARSVFKDGLYAMESPSGTCANLNLLDCQVRSVKAKVNHMALTGKIVQKSMPINAVQGVSVGIYSSAKKLIKKTNTDMQGSFLVDDLAIDQEYIVRLTVPDQEDIYAEMLYVNDQGKALKSSSSKDGVDENGFFHFEYLPSIKEKLYVKPVEEEPLGDLLIQEKNRSVVMENLFFKAGSHQLMPSSKPALEGIYASLNKYPELNLLIMGFTDNIGLEADNKRLSELRAKAVVDYLIQKGIASNRLKYEGWGSQKSIAENNTPEGRMKNRRVEIKLIP